MVRSDLTLQVGRRGAPVRSPRHRSASALVSRLRAGTAVAPVGGARATALHLDTLGREPSENFSKIYCRSGSMWQPRSGSPSTSN